MKKKQYRVKTKEEMIMSFGRNWKYSNFCGIYNNNNRTGWVTEMDSLLGTIIDKKCEVDGDYEDELGVSFQIPYGSGRWSFTINQVVEINIKPTYKRKSLK